VIEEVRKNFAALRSSAAFWSLRYVEEVSEILAVRSDVAEPPRRSLDRGAMLVALADGGYGYAATSDISLPGLQAALDCATQWARATAKHSVMRVSAAEQAAPRGRRAAPGVDTPQLTRKELYELLSAECRAAATDARIVDRYAEIVRTDTQQLYLTSNGGEVEQRYRFTFQHLSVTAHEHGDTQTRSLSLHQQGGDEILRRAAVNGSGACLAQEALALLGAPNCPSGAMDVLLMPDQMMLQIHESIGHPLELDRILGDERNYAGTSFVTADMFGNYQYGSPLLNVTYDPERDEELASFAYDDEGEAACKVFLIRDGILQRPLGGRLSQARARLPGTANTRASNWNRPPIDRMANLNVEPGASSLPDMIAGIERGVLMKTNVSWSIDDSRNKFQFGCEWGELIENGQLKGVVKNPNYRGISATFWRSLRMVGRPDTVEVLGTQYCGKGEPNQAIYVGHAAPACVFGNVDVFGGE
jgi:predicted Zn-dependent protease